MKRLQNSAELPGLPNGQENVSDQYVLENWWSEEEMTLMPKTQPNPLAERSALVAVSPPPAEPISARAAFARLLRVHLFHWS